MSKIENTSPYYYKDIDILYEGAGILEYMDDKKYHDFFRICYFEDTKGILHYEGTSYQISENQTVVIKPNTVYDIDSYDDNVKYFDLNFLDKKSIYNIDQLFKTEFIFNINDLFYRQCFIKTINEANDEKGSKLLLQSGIGFCLLSMIFREMKLSKGVEINKREISRNNIFLLSEIETKLNEDFISNSIISNLAYAVGVSENKLYKVIKETYDVSPKQWILEMKIKKIKIMLVERKTYQEITDLLAFSSVSHMSATFKKYVGCTPNNYLKNYSNK
ncbi:AraC family transcriptional regulator [Mycoplasma sp. P36-A1]|uniref:AraC family transcriptional regulator n=1 Tax=Mycoplasma sp. P36-A1 TaxID=3252900 RepID=UPI003C2FB55F